MSGPLAYKRLLYGEPAIELTPVGVKMYGSEATAAAVQLADADAYAELHPFLGQLDLAYARGETLLGPLQELLDAYRKISFVDVSDPEPRAVLARRDHGFERIVRVPIVDDYAIDADDSPADEGDYVHVWSAERSGRWVHVGHEDECFMSGEFPSEADAIAITEKFNRASE